jgi:hypothetical protein
VAGAEPTVVFDVGLAGAAAVEPTDVAGAFDVPQLAIMKRPTIRAHRRNIDFTELFSTIVCMTSYPV